MELREYLVLLLRWWWLILLLILLGGGIGLGLAFFQEPIYQTSTTLLINQAPGAMPDAVAVTQGQRVSSTYAELLTQRPVLDQVIRNLNLTIDAGTLESQVNVRPIGSTSLLELIVRDSDPQRAALIANEIVNVFIAQNLEFQSSRYAATLANLEPELARVRADIDRTTEAFEQYDLDDPSLLTQDQINERNRLASLLSEHQSSYALLLDRYESVRSEQARTSDTLSVVETALPGMRTGSSLQWKLLQGMIVGGTLAVGLLLLSDYLDDRVRSVDEVSNLTGIPIMGVIGNIQAAEKRVRNALVTVREPRSAIAEAYRMVRTNLEFFLPGSDIQTIIITSSTPREGKTTTAANLAVALAQAGKSVILVDGDMRRPTLHKLFRQENKVGLTTALLDEGHHGVQSYCVATGLDNLYLLPSGPLPPNPADVLQSRRMVEFIEQLKMQADIIVFDSPPVLAVADPILLGRLCDVMVLVVLAESTRIGTLRRTMTQLTQSGLPVQGIVFNRATSSRDTYHYYSGQS